MKYGPNTPAVERLIEQAHGMTLDQSWTVEATQRAAGSTVWKTTLCAAQEAIRGTDRSEVWSSLRDAAWDAVWDAAWGAALALMARNKISEAQFGVLYGPWASVFGEPK